MKTPPAGGRARSACRAAIALTVAALAVASGAQHAAAADAPVLGSWSPVGSGVGVNVSGAVYDLAIDGTSLYASGLFPYVWNSTPTAPGEVAGTRNVAKWDGSAWSSMGGGLPSTSAVQTLAVSAGTVYAGWSPAAPGSAGISAWSGGSWSTIAALDGYPGDLEMGPDGSLYAAGGFFNVVGNPGNPVGNLIRWADGAWTGLGAGYGDAMTMAQSGGTIYLGGGGLAANVLPGSPLVASLAGGAWTDLGLADGPYAFAPVKRLAATADGELFAGGLFMTAGGAAAPYIASWDGSRWSAVGDGLNDRVNALAIDDAHGLVYAGGDFTSTFEGAAGALSLVGAWDRGIHQWVPLRYGPGNGLPVGGGGVGAIATDGRAVYVGGPSDAVMGDVPGCVSPDDGLNRCNYLTRWTWAPPTGANALAAARGATVTITGDGLVGVPATGAVRFGSAVVGTYSRTGTTEIVATVPADAPLGKQEITVNGAGGWGSLGSIDVAPAPALAPGAGAVPAAPGLAAAATPEQLRRVRLVRPARTPALGNGVPAGQVVVLKDGRRVPARTALDPRSISVTADPVTLRAGTRSGGVAQRLAPAGTLSLPEIGASGASVFTPTGLTGASPDPSVQLSGGGYAASSPARVFVVPQPTARRVPRARLGVRDLGYLMTDAGGTIGGGLAARVRQPGAYILQVNVEGRDEAVWSINMPLTVRARASRAVPVAG